MKKTIKNLKQNKGFTLVELLVSVAIFALISSPLIHAYLTAQSTSRRSHYLGDATLAASNIVEIIRAAGAGAVLTNGLEGADADFNEDTGEYTFVLMDYRAGMSRFDLRVTLNAESFTDINNMQITNYSPMDGVFAQPKGAGENPDILAETYLENQAFISGIPFEADDIRRTITVFVDDDGVDTRITATYQYTLGSLTSPLYNYEFYRGKTVEAPKSVYVCYQPFYRGTDIIEIDNRAGMNLNVFVVKQDFIQIPYNAVIRQLEPIGTEAGKENTSVYSNFNADPFANGALHIYREVAGYTVGEITGELVSRSTHDRMYGITVHVFERGQLEAGGRHMIRFEAAQLD
ncbi:MAG: type II secretion system GspH family protein [Oscillospiraceae bacterium]|nr:type II secretion system GspH family protein [Oscillospiraceae bacterium]